MPSSLRFDPPAKKPNIDDYKDGEAYERAMDEWADAEAKRKPGVFIKKFRGSRDGDDRAVHLAGQHGEGEHYQLITKKTGDSGKDNRAFRNRVEDFIGQETDDNDRAVAEGERAQQRAEEGMTFINDMVKAIALNGRLGAGPVFKLLSPEGSGYPTHMVRGYMDTRLEVQEAVIEVCEISHFDSEGDAIPDTATLRQLRRSLGNADYVVPITAGDRVIVP